jgi:hypothetical protein
MDRVPDTSVRLNKLERGVPFPNLLGLGKSNKQDDSQMGELSKQSMACLNHTVPSQIMAMSLALHSIVVLADDAR